MIHLTVEEVLHVAARTLGTEPDIRDVGLIESAVTRPRATVFGEDAYPTIHLKAAALLHSLVTNHALVDGNKRLGLASTIVFYAVNGRRFAASNDQAYDLVIEIASSEPGDVGNIADRSEAMVEVEPA